MATGSDRAEMVARVWDMHSTARMTIRAIAAETGLPRSTVSDYISEGRVAEGYIHIMDREDARIAMAERLDAYTSITMQEHTRGMKWDKALPLLMMMENRRAKLLGLDAPSRVAVTDDRERPTPNPETMAAVKRLAAQERKEVGAPYDEADLGEDDES